MKSRGERIRVVFFVIVLYAFIIVMEQVVYPPHLMIFKNYVDDVLIDTENDVEIRTHKLNRSILIPSHSFKDHEYKKQDTNYSKNGVVNIKLENKKDYTKVPNDKTNINNALNDKNPAKLPKVDLAKTQEDNRQRKKMVIRPLTSDFKYPLDLDFPKLIKLKIENDTDILHKHINPHPFNYLHRPPDCNYGEGNTTKNIIILVKSTITDTSIRTAIRQTWGKQTPKNVRIVFLLGTSISKKISESADLEANTFHDIVQEDFIDSYLNNTYKTIMGFNWSVGHCSQSDILFFVDDDHYVFISKIVDHVNGLNSQKMAILFDGFLLPNSVPYRAVKSKWYISVSDFPYKNYPPYLAGGAFMVSFSVARKFTIAFPFIKYIGIDDSWLGIVAKKIGVKPKHLSFFRYRQAFFPGNQNNMFAVHGFKNPKDVHNVYNKIVNDSKSTLKPKIAKVAEPSTIKPQKATIKPNIVI